MKIYLLTLFPRALESYFETSIMQKALSAGALDLRIYNIADYSTKNTRRSDDRPYGWLPWTIIAPEPCSRTMDACIADAGEPIEWIAPDARGEFLNQWLLRDFSRVTRPLGILCGHYEWIDERIFTEYQVQKIALWPYIITGGELAAGILIDGIVRLIPGLLSESSLKEESYSDWLDGKKEYPHYTRPEIWRGHSVPSELLSGNPLSIKAWKQNNIQ